MAYQRQERTFDLSKEAAWQATEQASGILRWSIQSGNKAQGLMELKSRFALMNPMGILLSLKFEDQGPQKTRLMVEAKSLGQMIDYGQANREIRHLFTTLDMVLNPGMNSNSMAQGSFGSICLKCGSMIKADAKFCGKCGEPIDNSLVPSPDGIVCSGCGKLLKPDARFCTGCGQQLK